MILLFEVSIANEKSLTHQLLEKGSLEGHLACHIEISEQARGQKLINEQSWGTFKTLT